MILLTIGTQLPFDRLVRAMDELAPRLGEEVIGQIGDSAAYRPAHFDAKARVPPAVFERYAKSARVIVSHAGIGTILNAGKLNKPIVVFPRRADLREHRNDHQLATCRQLRGRPGIYVAETVEELERLLTAPVLAGPEQAEPEARVLLASKLREVIGNA